MGRLFGTDGIRGVANTYPMTAEMALRIGMATASYFKRTGHRPRIIVGKDTRISGYIFESALVAGICSMGVDALMVGVMPTPGISFLTNNMRADAGIVISASHNPYQDNGIKIFSREGYKLPDETEEAIEDMVLKNSFSRLYPSPMDFGKAYRLEGALGRYIVFLKRSFPKDLSVEGMKIVIDCANGAAYRAAPEMFFELGANITTLFDKPNGININDNCGSQHTGILAEAVLRGKADIGFAFDGDGDRVIAVDEKGNTLTGDQIMVICAKTMKEEGALRNNTVVATVMSNVGFASALKNLGIEQVNTKVGDRYVLETMLHVGASLGGEQSGHMLFLDHHTTGDGILSALQLLKSMKREEKPLSELAKFMKNYPQKLMNIEVASTPDLSTIPEISNVISRVERRLGDRGRVLVRYSGTQNLCRVMVEAPSLNETERFCEEIARVIHDCLGVSCTEPKTGKNSLDSSQ
ncbi:MAG: phosphoglucosamine mutase [Deltaproteobacteria bacterium]|nr:phosphoglucosamine mutase [Deltaproteobacteria bacterium]